MNKKIGTLTECRSAHLSHEPTSHARDFDIADLQKQELEGETKKSRAEFLRGQRQVLYSKIVEYDRQLFEAETECEFAIAEPDTKAARETFAKAGFRLA